MYFNFSLSVAIFGLILYSQVQSLPANEKTPQDLPSSPSNVTSDVMPSCPSDFPFAYQNGSYCCKYDKEHADGGNAEEKQSGTCDGIQFSKNSTCCHEHDYTKCPASEKCDDYQADPTIASTKKTTITTTTTTTTTTTLKASSNASSSEPSKEDPNNPSNTTPKPKSTSPSILKELSTNKTTTSTTNLETTTTSKSTTMAALTTNESTRSFDGWSFFGGIIVTILMAVIAFVGVKYYQTKRMTRENYNLM